MIYLFASLAVFSIIINIGLFWYIRNLLRYSREMLGDFIEVSDEFTSFVEHLDAVYKMDRFYGDATLEGMLEHTKELGEFLEGFVKQKKDLFEEEQNDNKEDTNEKEEAQ